MAIMHISCALARVCAHTFQAITSPPLAYLHVVCVWWSPPLVLIPGACSITMLEVGLGNLYVHGPSSTLGTT